MVVLNSTGWQLAGRNVNYTGMEVQLLYAWERAKGCCGDLRRELQDLPAISMWGSAKWRMKLTSEVYIISRMPLPHPDTAAVSSENGMSQR